MDLDIDADTRVHVLDSFKDLSNEMEIELHRIEQGHMDMVDSFLMTLSNVKDNASSVHLYPVIDFADSLVELAVAINENEVPPWKLVLEVLNLGVDRLRDLHYRHLLGHQFGDMQEIKLQLMFGELARSRFDLVDDHCVMIIELLGAGVAVSQSDPPTAKLVSTEAPQATSSDRQGSNKKTPPASQAITCVTMPEEHSKRSFDIEFFRVLALQVDRQSQYWEGRSEQLNEWAQKINALSNRSVDPEQLAAATYLHDIGMCYLPHEILTKGGELNEQELAEMKQHPLWAYNYLIRIQGWDGAATIILDHHERIDGKGYPHGNPGELIHDGAKILAIIDAFFSITNGRADRCHPRSLVRAVSDINARVGTQFDAYWVELFNEMIKEALRTGQL